MPEGIPLDRVSAMRGQGLTNAQIIQGLQSEGYSSAQIFDALSQADVKSGAPEQTVPEGEKMEQGQPGQPEQSPAYPQQAGTEERIAQISEAIIEEKWSELVEHVNKIIEWKGSVESKLVSVEEQFKGLKDNFDKLHSAVIGKIGEYDVGIKEVGTSLKAMEEVFKKILPGFVENVQELSRITSRVKTTKKK
ncbi:hypothetical protein ACFLZ7_02870 [Nanoarchaeota archaeon]